MPPAVFGGLLSARQPAGKALLASAAVACSYYLSWLLSLVSFFFSYHRNDLQQPSSAFDLLFFPSLSPSVSLCLSLSLLPTPPLPPSLTLCAFKAHAPSSPKTKKCTQPLHASFPKFASLYPPKESAAALVTALGRATALATIVYCVWVFAAAAVVRDDHKGPAELAEEKRKKQGSKKRA